MPDVDPDLTDEPRRLAEAARRHLRRTLPGRPGGRLRRQLRRRRDRHARRGRVRGQRPDVPHAAGDAHHRDGHREGRADLGRPGGVPAAAAPLVHRRADEPVHLDVDRGDAGRRAPASSTWCCSTTAAPRRWPTRSAARRCTASGAAPASTSARCTSAPAATRTARSTPGRSARCSRPQLTGVADNSSLPYASTLCGACFDACPVRIDIPSMLVHLRARTVEERRATHRLPSAEAMAMAAAAWVMSSPARFAAATRAATKSVRVVRLGRRTGRIRSLPPPLSAWTETRDAPLPPGETFRQWWKRTRGGDARD